MLGPLESGVCTDGIIRTRRIQTTMRTMNDSRIRKYKLLALDLDGTLLNSDEEISDETLLSLHRAKEKGVKVIITTGRSTSSARRFIDLVNIPDPCITYNGAIISNAHRIFRSITIDEESVAETVLLLKQKGYTPVLYGADDMRYLEHIEKHRDGFYSLSKGIEDRIVHVPDFMKKRWREIIRISVFADEDDIPGLNSVLEGHRGKRIRTTETYFPDLNFWIYEILDSRCSKSNALQYLCTEFGIESEDVIAVGDNRNDLDMIEWAGLGIAMRNSLPDVMDCADYVTRKNNDEGGVSEVIHSFILS